MFWCVYCGYPIHDDVIKWKHFPRYWPFVRGINRSPVDSPHKGQWRGVFMFCLILSWTNSWVNNRDAGDLRHHHAHYDVTVMTSYLRVKMVVIDALASAMRPATYDNHSLKSYCKLKKMASIVRTAFFRRRSKKTWKLRVTGLCAGNSPGTGEFPAQMASNAENVSIWWRHHVNGLFPLAGDTTLSLRNEANT